jgi:hypothetical protein
MMDFKKFRNAVQKQFDKMAKTGNLFVTATDKIEIWDTYLGAFPEGTNPIYKNRTEHDCNCCNQFIRAVGNVVTVKGGVVESIWDCIVSGEPAYQAVADALASYVKSKSIADKFLHYERSAGTEKSFAAMVGGGATQWDHFHVMIPAQYVVRGEQIGTMLGALRTSVQTTTRALNELSEDAADTVLDLIANGSLYRGDEMKFQVTEFMKMKKTWDKLSAAKKATYVWENIGTIPGSVSGFRNTSIGKLVDSLSKDDDLESAVHSYELMVAPTNYRRSTALVTKQMIDDAKKKIADLGLTSALERRYAVLGDITINNVLYANRDAKSAMAGDVFDQLGAAVVANPKKLDKVEEVGIEKFLTDVMPKATSLEIMVENKHSSNFVSLIAPENASANPLFKWGNDFSWSYTGDLADSMKEKVKAAGGNVTGELCCRLAWEYTDDLDFHMYEPDGHIYFGTRDTLSKNGGKLDVDANGGSGMMDHPVENIFYQSVSRMKNGTYSLKVHNFRRRSDGAGFQVEIDLFGEVHHFETNKVIGNDSVSEIAKIIKDKDGIRIEPVMKSTVSGGPSKEVWGVHTNTFVPVNVVMLSPNFWDDKNVGNKHYFFMIEGCANDGQARGFYNEFLREDLNPHRKVLEMVGSKMKTEKAEKQLSGVGFSSTIRNSMLVKVNGKFSRIIRVVF